jgi:uncharacterized membrane protein
VKAAIFLDSIPDLPHNLPAMSNAHSTLLFCGRLHPLLVHLPIGIILLLTLLEYLGRFNKFKQANAGSGIILAAALSTAWLTVLCGWLLSREGGYPTPLVQWHFWTGIGTALALTGTGILHQVDLKKAYRGGLYLSTLILIITAHFGGSLTHGGNYLFQFAPPFLRSLFSASPEGKSDPALGGAAINSAYAAIAHPLFQKYCVECHGPTKSKGELRLDSAEALLKGGKSGSVLAPGKPSESEILRRLQLSPAEEDHMPPEGTPQPTPSEITLLEWWINTGASIDKKPGDLNPSADIERMLGK